MTKKDYCSSQFLGISAKSVQTLDSFIVISAYFKKQNIPWVLLKKQIQKPKNLQKFKLLTRQIVFTASVKKNNQKERQIANPKPDLRDDRPKGDSRRTPWLDLWANGGPSESLKKAICWMEWHWVVTLRFPCAKSVCGWLPLWVVTLRFLAKIKHKTIWHQEKTRLNPS